MPGSADFSFRLYVAGGSPASREASANLSKLCLAHFPGRHSIDIVDVLDEPNRALSDGVMLVPSLLILSPPPVRRIIGTLSQAAVFLQTLGFEPLPSVTA